MTTIEEGEGLFAPNPVPPFASASKGRNHYDILGVGFQAPRSEIRAAYIRLKNSLEASSGASYSLLNDSDSHQALRELDEAYRTLEDDYLRKKYNQQLGLSLDNDHDATQHLGAQVDSELEQPSFQKTYPPVIKAAAKSSNEQARAEIDRLITESGRFDGSILGQIREHLEVNPEEIQTNLKISKTYVKALEEDTFDILPPLVYIRGFLKTLLDYFQIKQTSQLIESYSRNYNEWKKKQDKR